MSIPADLEDIFFAALARGTKEERTAFLSQTCRNEPETKSEAERLLAAHARLDDFLEEPPAAVAAAAEELRPPASGGPDLGFLESPTRPNSLGRLGHYEILELLGSGAFGTVVRAFDDKLHRTVAIKTLSTSLVGSSAARQRFVREARAAAAVRHENVVHVYEVEEEGPIPYLVMEYVAGSSLEEKLRNEGPLKFKEVLSIGLQTADGLAAAHQQGLVHRDIKLGNILLESSTGRVKITDFGLARAVDDASLSREGLVAGTPEYMSPEQARGQAVDHRTDLFSLGSVLYSMCTGRSPFAAEGSLAVLKRICESSPRDVRELRPDVPVTLAQVIALLHARNPADRPGSAEEVRVLLERCRDRPAKSAVPPIAGRRRWLIATGSAAAAAGLGICLSQLRQRDDGESPTEQTQDTAALPTRPAATIAENRRRWRPRVLLILPARDFYYPEYGPVLNMLKGHGVECHTASTTLEECLPNAWSHQIPVKPDLLLADVKTADYDAIFFCGGEGGLEYAEDGKHAAEAQRLIREAIAAQRTVSAIGNGVVILADANVLRGKRATCSPWGKPPGIYVRWIEARGAICTQDPVTEDGLFLTGRAPDNVRAFTEALLKRLGIEPIQWRPAPSD